MDRIELEAKRYLANIVYGMWEESHDMGRNNHRFYEDNTLETKQRDLTYQMGMFLHLGLIEDYLFPNYDKYLERVKRYVDDSIGMELGETKEILKSPANPRGSSYRELVIKFPKNIFRDIEGCFLDRLDFTVRCIYSKEYELHFWYNIDPGYDRHNTVSNWKNSRTVKGASTVVCNDFRSNTDIEIITYVTMSALISAYNDCVVENTISYIPLHIGTGKFVHKVDELLERSNVHWRKAVAKLLKEADSILREMDYTHVYTNAPSFAYIDFNKYDTCPEESIEKALVKIMNSSQFKELDRLEYKLEDVLKGLEDADEREVCQLWNQCSKQKASTKDEIRNMLTMKAMGVARQAFSYLALWMIYNENRTPRSLSSLI